VNVEEERKRIVGRQVYGVQERERERDGEMTRRGGGSADFPQIRARVALRPSRTERLNQLLNETWHEGAWKQPIMADKHFLVSPRRVSRGSLARS